MDECKLFKVSRLASQRSMDSKYVNESSTNRMRWTHQVRIGSELSNITVCTSGVPQGSVLGPILFSIYTRAVTAVAHPTPSMQFADDIALYQSGSNTATISLGLSSSVTALADWLENRSLILNERKSQVLSICGRDAQTSIAVNCHQTAYLLVLRPSTWV